MDDVDIRSQIQRLIDEEHELRDQLASGEIDVAEENSRLQRVEADLDQCWDLLRQRRARREFGEDPASAQVRPIDQVEGYRQ
jgi:predicted nuclease with TOPRIM domain